MDRKDGKASELSSPSSDGVQGEYSGFRLPLSLTEGPLPTAQPFRPRRSPPFTVERSQPPNLGSDLGTSSPVQARPPSFVGINRRSSLPQGCNYQVWKN